MGQGLLSQRLKTAGLLLALFALTFKALLPPGYMLTPEHGRAIVALCTIDGAMAMPLPGGAPDNDRGDHDDRGATPCVFATVGAIDVPTPTPAPRALLIVVSAFEWPSAPTRVGQGLAAPPPWPTGPPISI